MKFEVTIHEMFETQLEIEAKDAKEAEAKALNCDYELDEVQRSVTVRRKI